MVARYIGQANIILPKLTCRLHWRLLPTVHLGATCLNVTHRASRLGFVGWLQTLLELLHVKLHCLNALN